MKDTKQGILWQVARSLARQAGYRKITRDPAFYPTLVQVLGMLKDDPAPDFETKLKDIRVDVNRVMSHLNMS